MWRLPVGQCRLQAPLVTTTLVGRHHQSLVDHQTPQFLQMDLRCSLEVRDILGTTEDHHGLCSRQVRLGQNEMLQILYLVQNRPEGGRRVMGGRGRVW